MPGRQTNGVTAGGLLRALHVIAGGRGHGPADGELVRRFVARRDEAAFAALVRRHGPMVLGVCRRVLGDAHDAEDACQAAFLVLARKAASIRPPGRVGNWLYGVARRTAHKARAAAAARRARERAGARPEAVVPDGRAEWREVLDRELGRLPDRYRAAIVLCDLEGRPYKEAARLLGWPEGTLSGRLSRGRALLARRLLRRGLGLTAGAAALAGPDAAAVPVAATVRAAVGFAAGDAAACTAPAAALAKGVLQAMWVQTLKTAAGVTLLTGLLATGTGLAVRPTRAGAPVVDVAAAVERPRPAPPADPPVPPTEVDVYRMRDRNLMIPMRLNPERADQFQAVQLYVSTGRGQTWELADSITPDQKDFSFHAPADGLYWFAVRAVHRDGTLEPARLSEPQLKVLIGPDAPGRATRAAGIRREIDALRSRIRALEERLNALEAEKRD